MVITIFLTIVKLANSDKAINVVESPRLKKIFLMLRKDLKESDIPGRTKIREHVDKLYEEHLKELEEELKV